MKYDQALKHWGRNRLKYLLRKNEYINADDVNVAMNFNEGYMCCNGRDPDCYCSFAESPSANVLITSRSNKGRSLSTEISYEDFDFAEILKEIVLAADGVVTNE